MQSQLNGRRLIRWTSGSTHARVAGIFWLIACGMFLHAGILYLLGRDIYWIPAYIGLIISQILIIIYWSDAKYGTIINAIIFTAILPGVAEFHFKNNFQSVAERLIKNASVEHLVITEDSIKDLPQNVQRWLRQSNVVAKNNDNVIHVLQKGSLRLQPDAEWIPFSSEEYFTIDPPGFVWRADIRPSPFIRIGGRDKYENGEGSMVIMPFYIYTVTDAKGKEINQATLLRYLGEMAWFPQVAISDYLHWEEIDSLHASVTMTYKGATASGIFTFSNEGFPLQFEAQRYGDFDGVYKMETWSVTAKSFKAFHGKKIGYLNEVTWKLKEGDFLWMKMEVTDIQ